jgi:TRAP-type mannitol/chloroaromatic compound transport system substrate-binding protein
MTKVTRRKFIRTAGVGGVGAAAASLASPAIAQTMPELKWRLAASWPKSLDTLYGGCEHFCKRIAEITDNRFQIQPFAAGEIRTARSRWATRRCITTGARTRR